MQFEAPVSGMGLVSQRRMSNPIRTALFFLASVATAHAHAGSASAPTQVRLTPARRAAAGLPTLLASEMTVAGRLRSWRMPSGREVMTISNADGISASGPRYIAMSYPPLLRDAGRNALVGTFTEIAGAREQREVNMKMPRAARLLSRTPGIEMGQPGLDLVHYVDTDGTIRSVQHNVASGVVRVVESDKVGNMRVID